jgi:hypothetical protein
MSEFFKIEKNVPLPPSMRQRHASAFYPFGEMQIGDSFRVSGAAKAKRAGNAANAYGRRNSKKFLLRKDGDGYRCWRVA